MKQESSQPNRLQYETSPYLLQHAYNPVQWYPWGQEALTLAKQQDKPILVSIGYSTCHWCHVMERESFEDQTTAQFMNEHYICIKIDREERPDLDQIYMDACQIMTGAGGWPLNCFLTPDALPFYAGTYYPPQPAQQRPSWMQVLQNLHNAWVNSRQTVTDQAEKLLGYIKAGDTQLLQKTDQRPQATIDAELQLYQGASLHLGLTQDVFYRMREQFDRADGGFGHAPKFPSFMAIQYLLEYAHFRNNDDALLHAIFSLESMITGGIYDHLAGGISRYSTDNEWLAPHFEKMLYDNALLISTLGMAIRMIETASQKRGKNLSVYEQSMALFRYTIRHTYDFTLREMSDPATGAYYSAFDADSEGVEGKYYVWSKAEVLQHLGEKEGELFCAYFDVTEDGNWEHTNILRRVVSDTEFAAKYPDGEAWVKKNLPKAKEKLLIERMKRIPPELDNKTILSWNTLMVSAGVQAYRALNDEKLLENAQKTMSFLLDAFKVEQSDRLLHTYKSGTAKYAAMLDDYAYTIAALLDLYEATAQENYLQKAKNLVEVVMTDHEKEGSFFHFSGIQQVDVIVRKIDLYDHATPSANSTMALNLQRLGHLTTDGMLMQRSNRMLNEVKNAVRQFPLSFEQWAIAIQREAQGLVEIVVTGTDLAHMHTEIHRAFIPNAILAVQTSHTSNISLLKDKINNQTAFIYLCKDFACMRPVETLTEFWSDIFHETAHRS
jgi:uncharacterized protein